MDSLTSLAGFLNRAFGIFTATTHVAALSVRIVDETARSCLALSNLQQGKLSSTRATCEVITSATLIAADACSLAISMRTFNHKLHPEIPKQPYWKELIETGKIPNRASQDSAIYKAIYLNAEFAEDVMKQRILSLFCLRITAAFLNIIRDIANIKTPSHATEEECDALILSACGRNLMVHGMESVLLMLAKSLPDLYGHDPVYGHPPDPILYERNFSVDGLPPLDIQSSLANATITVINLSDLYAVRSKPMKIERD